MNKTFSLLMAVASLLAYSLVLSLAGCAYDVGKNMSKIQHKSPETLPRFCLERYPSSVERSNTRIILAKGDPVVVGREIKIDCSQHPDTVIFCPRSYVTTDTIYRDSVIVQASPETMHLYSICTIENKTLISQVIDLKDEVQTKTKRLFIAYSLLGIMSVLVIFLVYIIVKK